MGTEDRQGGNRAGQLLAVLAGRPMSHLVGNLECDVEAAEAPLGALPLTRTDGRLTCYICSPTVAYADYALEELRNFEAAPALKKALALLIACTRPLVVATGLDRQVQGNNWLLSTNIWCALPRHELGRMTENLVRENPRHALVWRSLNDRSDRETLADFRALGYRLLPARQVYLYDCRDALPPIRRDMKNDLKLLERRDYRVFGPESLESADFARIADLYGQLYREKYTPLNPDYTSLFLEEMHRGGLIEFHVLRSPEGRMDGVIGFFADGDVLTAPVVGYDRALPQEIGLYRRLVVFGMLEARRRRLLYNMSAGAARFKRTRGALPAIEYTAAYVRHLPLRQRACTRLMEALLAGIAVPVMKRYEL